MSAGSAQITGRVREQTQTNLDPGNCWQTCVACILDVDAAELPYQNAPSKFSYTNRLNSYLEKHHGLAYVEVHQPVITALSPPELHLMAGPTVRTPASGVHHVVVARRGQLVWDPHPSRAGLTAVERWGLVIPMPDEWKRQRDAWRSTNAVDLQCACPACSPEPAISELVAPEVK